MKALSLKQPYAELVVSGRKKIEIRKWNTTFRGRFLVHASKVPDKRGMKSFGFSTLPLGAIVGEARLVGVKKYENEADFMKDKKLHLADTSFGMNGFLLEDAKRVTEVACKGKLSFWEFT